MGYEDSVVAAILTALYLRGGPGDQNLPRIKWQRVEAALRSAQPSLEHASKLLSLSGFWLEGAALQAPGVLAAAERLIEQEKVLCVTNDAYPSRWLSVLGRAAPPVLWRSGELPPQPIMCIVGSRNIDSETRSFAFDAAVATIRAGIVVASGGAHGVDSAAAKGAVWASREAGMEPWLLELLPHGISLAYPAGHCRLSAVAPLEEFSSAAAMERNTLLYSIGERALVVAAQFRHGGAWAGATDCLRRKLSTLFVRNDASAAARALVALGGVPVTCVQEVVSPLNAQQVQATFRFEA